MKKLKTFQIILVLVFIIFIIFVFKSKNYTKEYSINNVDIKESYNKSTKSYYFNLTYKDITLDYLIESNYKQHRSFIENIKIEENESNFCLTPTSSSLEFIPLCYENNRVSHYSNTSLKKESNPTKIKTYKDIEIYNDDYTYLLWNYDGFYYINKDTTKKIDILNKELYSINLASYTKDYLILADYDSNYTFNKLYRIDFKTGSLKKFELDTNIYFDSYFPGHFKNKLYIVDNKESQMYEFNAKNGKLERVKPKILNNGKWENISIKKLTNNKEKFSYKTNYNYTLENDTLYLDYNTSIKTYITNNIKNIVRINNDDIYYIKNDSLYHFNPKIGEELLLTYFEWNFNYENMIYIN